MTYKTGVWGEEEKARSKKRLQYFTHYTSQNYRELKKLVLKKLGNKCKKCGFTDDRVLQVDHVNNDGFKERRNKISGAGLYRKVLKDKNNVYQLLCANCNWIKRLENKNEVMNEWIKN
jgi:hypothetical protein